MAANTYQFANNANTTIAAPINTVTTTVTVAPGDGAKFPLPTPNFPFLLTFSDAATGGITEIVLVTARSGDSMTIIRGQEGTTPQSWLGGDIAANLITAGTLNNTQQIPQAQQSAANEASDTGTANSYVAAFSPPITQHFSGMTLRVKFANANNGASTLDIGAGPLPLVNPDGSALGTGAILGGGWGEIVDDVTRYQLISSTQQAQSSAGAATTGDFKFRPTAETISGWVIANATTIGSASVATPPAGNTIQRANADTANLFAWHWNNFSNTQSPVFTSAGAPTTRGANAAADFAANKQIQVYDKRGKGDIGIDTMQGAATTRLSGVPITSGNSTTPGSVLGENLHVLIAGEVPNLSMNFTSGIENAAHNHNTTIPSSSGNTGGGGAFGNAPVGSITGNENQSHGHQIVGSTNGGGGGSHNNVMLVDGMTYYIKL